MTKKALAYIVCDQLNDVFDEAAWQLSIDDMLAYMMGGEL
jgi:hypothetical protein